MLSLTIKKEWFDLITSGVKTEEYRQIKPFYFNRLGKHVGKTIEVILRNGYQRHSPFIRCNCSIRMGEGKPEWGAIEGVKYYILKIEEILEAGYDTTYKNEI